MFQICMQIQAREKLDISFFINIYMDIMLFCPKDLSVQSLLYIVNTWLAKKKKKKKKITLYINIQI